MFSLSSPCTASGLRYDVRSTVYSQLDITLLLTSYVGLLSYFILRIYFYLAGQASFQPPPTRTRALVLLKIKKKNPADVVALSVVVVVVIVCVAVVKF